MISVRSTGALARWTAGLEEASSGRSCGLGWVDLDSLEVWLRCEGPWATWSSDHTWLATECT